MKREVLITSRGGSYLYGVPYLRSVCRARGYPYMSIYDRFGLRVALIR